jgi:hypothetical protein
MYRIPYVYRKTKLLPLPLRPIKVETHFQLWGLDFIGELNPNLSGKHKWIFKTTYYFTKSVEVIFVREKTDAIIINLLEENILARFMFPRKIITDNTQAFKSTKLVQFFQNYSIEIGHSTYYYLLAANPFFFSIALKSCLHPLSYYDKSLSHCADGHSSHFYDHYNSISTQFSQLQV